MKTPVVALAFGPNLFFNHPLARLQKRAYSILAMQGLNPTLRKYLVHPFKIHGERNRKGLCQVPFHAAIKE